MPRNAYEVLWWLAAAAGGIGFVGFAAGAAWGGFVAVIGAIVFANLAWTKYPGAAGLGDLPRRLWVVGLVGGVLAVLGVLPTAFAPDVRGALVATGLQVLLVAAGLPAAAHKGPGRLLVALLGHATILLGTVLLLRGAPSGVLATCWAAGFAPVLLHAFWTQRERGGPGEEWEAVFLAALVSGLLVPVTLALFGLDPTQGLGLLAGVGLVALGVLGRPPLAPGRTQLAPGGPAATVAHALAGIALVNSVLFAYTLVSRWAIEAILFVVFAWVFLATALEYRAILRAWRRRRAARPVPEAEVAPGRVTVVVAAYQERHVLRSTLERNLSLRLPLRFILVPSASSPVTVALAEELAARDPDRVRVVLGTTGSKAGDLNLAWPLVETEHVLVLDADETIDEAFVRRGLAVLDADPRVGLVQGRKVQRDAEGSALARFVAAERRFSTWMDQPVQAEDGAAHFAGSGAILRWAVLLDVDGWCAGRLTEDIDLTLRLRLGTRWRVAYEPSMVVRESNPATLLDLLRQRTRWARGWAEVTGVYLPEVVKARRRLGTLPAASLAWQLVASVSAPWATLLPLLVLIRTAGLHPILPFAVALPLALVIIPVRFLVYADAARHDPVTPVRGGPLRWAELALHAYLWVLLGWVVQIHALYLELSEAPRDWHVTHKEGLPARARPHA